MRDGMVATYFHHSPIVVAPNCRTPGWWAGINARVLVEDKSEDGGWDVMLGGGLIAQ
jgi:hypothetical protein